MPLAAEGPVLVVGGGLVGLSCAWSLRKAGADVVVIERGEVGGGASRGNAGAICPSMVDPLPAPGMIREALATIGRSDAALHVHPAYAPRLAGFLRRFTAAATAERYERGVRALAQLGRGVTDAYDELAAAGIGTHAVANGYLFVHADRDRASREREQIARMASMGLCAEPGDLLGVDDLRAEEPLLAGGAIAGFVEPGERSIDPSSLVDDLAAALRVRGVEIVTGSPATTIATFEDGVEVETVDEVRNGAAAVVAAGAWTPRLLERLGVRLPIRPGKGYSFDVSPEPNAKRALHLSGAHVMATPMGRRLRVAGTMEFDGTMDRFNPGRVDAMVRAAQPYLRIGLTSHEGAWVGPRPMTPDGLPYLGRVPGHDRVIVAAGHNMIGLTLAPVTGRVVAGLVIANDPGIDLAPFAVDR